MNRKEGFLFLARCLEVETDDVMAHNQDTASRANLQLIEEIALFIEYGVAAGEKATALDVLKGYGDNEIALAVLGDFYRRLPEMRDEAAVKVGRIVSRMGAFLLRLTTTKHEYIYFHNGGEAIYLGETDAGIGDQEVLSHFGFSDNDAFLKKLKETEEDDEEKAGAQIFCPACGVPEGELHLLGCPVEVCPWCDGQFNYCNCRFERLGVDEITEEDELDRLETLMEEQGRVPFRGDQAPSYPTGGSDADEG